VVDVLTYGDRVTKNGLNLLTGPGNDMVAVTNLAAVGCHMVLFSTGRGTPLGSPVPTVKIATNDLLAEKKKNWIDFNAGPMLNGTDLAEEFMRYIIRVANVGYSIGVYCVYAVIDKGFQNILVGCWRESVDSRDGFVSDHVFT
jgi:altronate dehydratase